MGGEGQKFAKGRTVPGPRHPQEHAEEVRGLARNTQRGYRVLPYLPTLHDGEADESHGLGRVGVVPAGRTRSKPTRSVQHQGYHRPHLL